MNTDEKLWEGVRRGNEEMFLELHTRYYHTLLFIGLKEIADFQLIKDTIQQLFLYLWEKRQTIQQADNVKSYLITSFLRKLTTDWKRSGKMAHLHIASDTKEFPLTPEETLINKYESDHLSHLIANCINMLPSRQRELIILRFYEGLSYEAIAEQTGLSQRTIYNSIYEAIKKLRVEMLQKSPAASSILKTSGGLLTLLASLSIN